MGSGGFLGGRFLDHELSMPHENEEIDRITCFGQRVTFREAMELRDLCQRFDLFVTHIIFVEQWNLSQHMTSLSHTFSVCSHRYLMESRLFDGPQYTASFA
jgi:hypothetical protein